MKVNKNFDNLVPNYLFADVARKTNEFAAAHPEKEIIKLGIGDVTLPLAPVVVEAMKKGCEDLKFKETLQPTHSSLWQELAEVNPSVLSPRLFR